MSLSLDPNTDGNPPQLLSDFASEQDTKDQITDPELGDLSGKILPHDMPRISVEFLKIPLTYIAGLSQENPWKFVYKCLDIWRKSYSGGYKRAQLHRCLYQAAEAGLVAKDAKYCFSSE